MHNKELIRWLESLANSLANEIQTYLLKEANGDFQGLRYYPIDDLQERLSDIRSDIAFYRSAQ